MKETEDDRQQESAEASTHSSSAYEGPVPESQSTASRMSAGTKQEHTNEVDNLNTIKEEGLLTENVSELNGPHHEAESCEQNVDGDEEESSDAEVDEMRTTTTTELGRDDGTQQEAVMTIAEQTKTGRVPKKVQRMKAANETHKARWDELVKDLGIHTKRQQKKGHRTRTIGVININGVKNTFDGDALAEAARDAGMDMLCLQELHTTAETDAGWRARIEAKLLEVTGETWKAHTAPSAVVLHDRSQCGLHRAAGGVPCQPPTMSQALPRLGSWQWHSLAARSLRLEG